MNVARHSRDFLAEALSRPAIAALVKQTRQQISQHPEECVVVGQKYSSIQIRVGKGKRSWVSMRALLWIDEIAPHTDLEPPAFSTPSCGTAGCVNPAHQVPREDTQRVKVVRNVHAA